MKKIKHPRSKLSCIFTWLMMPISAISFFLMLSAYFGTYPVIWIFSKMNLTGSVGLEAGLTILVLLVYGIYAGIVTAIASVIAFTLGVPTTLPTTIAAITGKPPLIQQLMVSVASIFQSLFFTAATVFNIWLVRVCFHIHPVVGIIFIVFALISLTAIAANFLWFVSVWVSVAEGFKFKKRKEIKEVEVVEELAPVETPALESADETALPETCA